MAVDPVFAWGRGAGFEPGESGGAWTAAAGEGVEGFSVCGGVAAVSGGANLG